jgi:hypothetical protein
MTKQFHQKKSQVLLLIEINSKETSIIPGKLFEYMVSEDLLLP